jgi:hypothetical protein
MAYSSVLTNSSGEERDQAPGKRVSAAAGLDRSQGPALVLLAALVGAAPIWLHGAATGDDFEFHLVSWLNAQLSWLHGIAYPHWAVSPNFGAGEARFVFYPPLSWMLGAALGLALPWALVPFALAFLLLASTGLATRALAREYLPAGAATLAGCAAIFSSYALFSTYFRTAFAELAGGCFIPLLLLFACRDRNPRQGLWRRALDGSALALALVLAGCWLSDAPVGVMSSYLLAAVAVAGAVSARSWFPVLRAAVAYGLGLALAGFYLIPAAWEQRWVEIQQATGVDGDPGLKIENNWLFPHHAGPPLSTRDQAMHLVTPVAVGMIAVAALSLMTLWMRGRLASGKGASLPVLTGQVLTGQVQTGQYRILARRTWILLASIPAAVLFLLLPISLPVWDLLPKLRFLQFPWRWLLVVEAPMALLFASAVVPRLGAMRRQRVMVALLCTLGFAVCTVLGATHLFRVGVQYDDLATILGRQASGTGFIGTDEYAPLGADNSTVAMGLPDACLASDFDTELGVTPEPGATPQWQPDQHSCMATAAGQGGDPEHWRVQMSAAHAGFVILRLRSYPAWRITLNGHQVADLPARVDGLISVPVAQGPVALAVDWRSTPDVLAGREVSALGLMGLIWLGVMERRYRRG